MKGQVILNSIFIATVLMSGAVFADSNSGHENTAEQSASAYVAFDVDAVTAGLQSKLDDDNHAEVVSRIVTDSRQELSRQLETSQLLDEAVKGSQGYLRTSLSDTDGKISLTAR